MAIDLKTKLSAYWSADGTYADSHNSQHLTQTGTVGTGTGHVYDAAWSFPHVGGNYLSTTQINPAFVAHNVNFVVAAWYRANSWGGSRAIVTAQGAAFMLRNESGEALRWQVQDSGGSPGFPGPQQAAPTVGEWHLTIGWRDGSTVAMQTDGGEISTATLSGSGPANTTTGTLAIGDNSSALGSMPFDGRIGPVSIWRDRVLTADERAYVYNNGAGRPYSEFVEAGGGINWPLIRRIAALGDLRFSPSGVTY